jgi:hypothetical protein
MGRHHVEFTVPSRSLDLEIVEGSHGKGASLRHQLRLNSSRYGSTIVKE